MKYIKNMKERYDIELLKTIPGIFEIIDGKVDIKNIRDVEIEDLLGREPIKTNLEEISDYLENKVVLDAVGNV